MRESGRRSRGLRTLQVFLCKLYWWIFFVTCCLPSERLLPTKQLQESDGRKLQLHFMTCLPEKLFTGKKLKGKQGGDIQIMLMDANTGNIVSSGPESSLHLEIVVVDGDFDNLPHADWTHEQFERHIVKERKDKRPLLVGQLKVALNNGAAALGEILFTDNSRCSRSQKFRLGVRAVAGQSFGLHVREAKSEAFSVKENRGEDSEKHYPPKPNSEVWRLEGIAKNGPYHNALTKESIFTVEGFVRQLVMNPEGIRNIFRNKLKTWDRLVKHARTCTPSKKIYAYYDDEAKKTLVFNNVYEVIGLSVKDNYIPTESLPGHEKAYLDSMKKKAHRDRINFKEFDEEALPWHDRRGEITEPNPVTVETGLPVEEFSIPSIPMEHTDGSLALMLQHQARQDSQLGGSSAAASSGDPTASTAPTDPPLFIESASCSSFLGKTQVGMFGSCPPVHRFGQHDFHLRPPILGPCLPAVHNAGQHVEEFSNPSMPRENNKVIPASMPEEQAVQDTQLGQSSALASSRHTTASTAPNDAPLLDDSASRLFFPRETQVETSGSLEDAPLSFDDIDWAEMSPLLDGDLCDNLCFSYSTLQEADAGSEFWPPVNQHSQKAVTSWLKLRLALRAVTSMRTFATRNRTRLMEQGWGTASHGNCGVYAV
ncbi:calmodulin-binding protein 60 D-like isoform X2 [Nymphaea colorata]|uniref:calmodulin-binding protein 60 D-like isoform X2 n=1 Tax=Nymphaea colorata TaxID=210225 RepID=UPI00214F0C24|nr:calmodulin-binding protein 60 D-like isoform X2 [Nymphaea colorata]